MQKALKRLGIHPSQKISLDVMLGEHFNGRLYGLDEEQIGRVRALRDIVASYEKSHRTAVKKVACSRDAVSIFHPMMKDLEHEEVAVAFLNNSNAVLHTETLYRGAIAEVAFSPRDIISRALSVNATGIIVAHNHPSGEPHPSVNDIRQTEELKKACDLMGISLLDHIIISRRKFYSFSDEAEINI